MDLSFLFARIGAMLSAWLAILVKLLPVSFVVAAMVCLGGCDLEVPRVVCDKEHLEDAGLEALTGRLAELGFEELEGLFDDDD